MRPLRLGFLSPLAVVVTAAGLAAVGAIVIVHGAGMFSPGPLSQHAGELRGGVRAHAEIDDCSTCHPAPWSRLVVSDRCEACHTEVVAEIRGGEGLHGKLPGATWCLDCHTEHRGADARLTDTVRVPHESFGFSLQAHRRRADGAPFACADCHAESIRSFDSGACTDCHDRSSPGFSTVHIERWGDRCLACHDGVDRYGRNRFDHSRYRFSLTGRHRQIACTDCHPMAREPADFRKAPDSCVDCHPEPDDHRGQFGTACGNCHSTDTWRGARFDHRFPLDHGRRTRAPCATCHPDAPDYDTYSCYGCHEHTPANVRREHLEEGIRDFRDCVRCHPTGREHEGRGGQGEHDDD